ncbi:TPA: helix-turn-helix domain-containing protein [Serratia marcescens]|nr:helix-turn-helix domain-containing protein [Serratia marcescens]
MSDLTVEKLSVISGYSKWHLQRLFKKHVGICIGTYVRYRRLSKSAIMLRLSKVKILDVAISYGFNSQQCYTRAFKNFFGKNPREFRKGNVWDFSRHMPPYDVKGFYYYVSSTQNCSSFFRKYRSLGYRKICHSNGVYCISPVSIKKQENRIKYKSRMRQYQKKGCIPKVVDGILNCFFCGYSLARTKYLVIPFRGEEGQDYLEFYEGIYDRCLPRVNAKLGSNFIIELFKEVKLDGERTHHVDVIIPIIE